MTTHSIVF